MKLSIILLLSLIAAVTIADNSIQSECHGCHFDDRIQTEGHFPSGFGQWTNQQCYGCHAEIIEIATNYTQGKKDQRYFTLPISDERIHNMAITPLPYTETGSHPWKGSESLRTNTSNLARFLMRPHGTCNKKGQCAAPKMMAYPKIEEQNRFLQTLATPHNQSSEQFRDSKQVILGERIFSSRCASCHSDSDQSGYNANAMSLFSADWIYQYANGMTNNLKQRQMPIVKLNQTEATQLEAFFQHSRRVAEEKVDARVKEYLTIFDTFKPHPMTKKLNDYIWNDFWRDADCVHCHGIEGRAKDAFESTIPGVVAWFENNDPKDLYERLITRLAEQEVGMGAKKPGMPMTGAALPPTLIGIIGGWIKNKCPDAKGEIHCDIKSNKDNDGKNSVKSSTVQAALSELKHTD